MGIDTSRGFDFAPADSEPEPAAVFDLPGPTAAEVLAQYADPRNWDWGGVWIGPGTGPTLAARVI